MEIPLASTRPNYSPPPLKEKKKSSPRLYSSLFTGRGPRSRTRPHGRGLPFALDPDEQTGARGRQLRVGHDHVLRILHGRRGRFDGVRVGRVGHDARQTRPLRRAGVRRGHARLQRRGALRLLRPRLQSNEKSWYQLLLLSLLLARARVFLDTGTLLDAYPRRYGAKTSRETPAAVSELLP